VIYRCHQTVPHSNHHSHHGKQSMSTKKSGHESKCNEDRTIHPWHPAGDRYVSQRLDQPQQHERCSKVATRVTKLQTQRLNKHAQMRTKCAHNRFLPFLGICFPQGVKLVETVLSGHGRTNRPEIFGHEYGSIAFLDNSYIRFVLLSDHNEFSKKETNKKKLRDTHNINNRENHFAFLQVC
jgi:hypothetical protein